MEILKQVEAAYNSLSLPEKEARNMALACALEPLSDKPGCVTRYEDSPKNTLEMFISGGVNIYPAYYHLAEHLQKNRNPAGMYQFFKEAVLLSKANRDGGQINLGILEFSFPIVAAHILYDPSSKGGVEELLIAAGRVVKETSRDDAVSFAEGKIAARDISFSHRAKQYEVQRHEVNSVFHFYQKEFERESRPEGHPTGVIHNKQFLENFPDIRLSYDTFVQSEGKFSDRLVAAYNAILQKKENQGIGPGLGADFIAVTIYLALNYNKDFYFIG